MNRPAVRVALGILIIVLAGVMAVLTQPDEPDTIKPVTILPACPTEDSTNCRWDAAVQGNSIGRSFIHYQGAVIFTN